MEVTPNTITTEIGSHLGRELDEPFKRLLLAKVDAWRSRLIRNSLQTKPQESKFFRQTIYVPMEAGSLVPECIGAEVCPAAISIKIIPIPLRIGSTLFDYVGSVDGKEPFYEQSPGTGNFFSAMKYLGATVKYSYVLGRFEVPDHPNLPALRVDGIFDSPASVMEFNCANSGVGCDYWDQPYPVTGDVKQMIVQGILQTDYAQPEKSEDKEVLVNP